MVGSMAVEDISTPFRSPNVYRLLGTEGFLEKIAVRGHLKIFLRLIGLFKPVTFREIILKLIDEIPLSIMY